MVRVRRERAEKDCTTRGDGVPRDLMFSQSSEIEELRTCEAGASLGYQLASAILIEVYSLSVSSKLQD